MKASYYQTLSCLFVSLFLLAGCSDSSQTSPGDCNSIDVSGFAKLTILPTDTTSTTTVDWRSKGVVTGVKNEGTCKVSWAFGITALVESYHVITTGESLMSLSEQQLIDCDAFGYTCSGGGNPIESLNGMIGQNGLQTEASYPYTGVQGTCQFVPSNLATIPGFGLLPSGDEESLKAYVAKGPVLAFIDTCNQSFADYTSGVYYEPMCSSMRPTRAVIVVGYGGDPGSEYWIVKSSLGTHWGLGGYIHMSRNRDNNCGIASFALSPANLPFE
ncbi:MAG: C1 family peptidase [Deltaproteobacteria bacterium]